MDNTKTIRVTYVDAQDANAVDIVELANVLGLNPKKQGSNHFIICPNHVDKHPTNCSLTVKKGRQIFKCFVCQEGGGPIKLVMDVKHCEWKEALQFIGQNFGLIKEHELTVEKKGGGWQGLTQAEYEKFGLQNAYPENIVGSTKNEYGEIEPKIENEKYTLRELAKDDSELHDTILIGKFSEKVYNLLSSHSLVEQEEIIALKEMYDEPYKTILLEEIKKEIIEYKELLKKGLMNPEKYLEVCIF